MNYLRQLWLSWFKLNSFSLLFVVTFVSGTQVHADHVNLSGKSIVWFANHNTVHAVDTQTNAVIHTIEQSGEVEDIVVDPNDRSLWVLSHKRLLKYDANAHLIFDLSLNDVSGQVPNPHFLTINSHDGSIWIAAGGSLQHITASGEFLHSWENKDKIDSVSVDMDGTLWVLAKDDLIRVTETGTEFDRQDAATKLKNTQHLLLDPLGEVLWFASQKQLFSLQLASADPPLPPYAISDPSGVSQIALDSIDGTLWLATANNLLAYNRTGQQVATIPLPKHLKPVEALSVDALSHDVWVGTKKVVARFSTDGTLLVELAVANELEALAIAPAYPRPKLTLIEPVDQSLTNDPTPTIRYRLSGLCGDLACDPGDNYYQSLNLNILLNNYQVGGQFTIEGNIASFTPSVRVSEGVNTLGASADDIYGNSSDTVNSSFTVDTIPPVFEEFTPEDGTVVIEDAVTITGSVDDASAVVNLENLSEIGGTVISTDPTGFSFSVPLALGANSFTFTATDPAGNQAQAVLTITRTIPLDFEVTNIEDGAVVSDNMLTLTGTVTGLPGTTVTVNGVQVEVDENGNFTLENIPLNPGQNTITIIATSPDGQIIQKTITVFLSSGGSWETPVLLSEGAYAAGSSYLGPLIAVDKKGNVLVVWEKRESGRFGRESIMASRYVVGTGWSNPVTVVPQLPRIGNVDLAMNEAGDAVVVYERCTSSSSCRYRYAYAIRFDATTGWETTPTSIDQGIRNRGFLPNVRVGIDAVGNSKAIILLNDRFNEVDYSPVTGWGGLSSFGHSQKHQWDFYLDKNGYGILGFEKYYSSGGYLKARRFVPGTGWSIFDELNAPIYFQNQDPHVGIDGNGDIITSIVHGFDVKLYRFNDSSGWSSELVGQSPNNYNLFTSEPHLSWNNNGGATVVWKQGGFPSQISLNEYRNGAWNVQQDISNNQQSYHTAEKPVTAINDLGDTAVAWRQRNDTGKYDIWANVRSVNQWSGPLPVNRNSYTVYWASVVIDVNGIATVVWAQQNDRYEPSQIYASRFNPGVSGGSAPVVTPPADIEMEATAVLTPVQVGQATATDSIDGELVATPDITGPFPVGSNFVTWSATNSQGVTRTAVQNVIINDTTPPALTVPADIEINVTDTTQLPIAINIGTASATDIFTPITITNDAPVAFDPGATIVKWTATDPNGNPATLEQRVTVNFDGDIFLRIANPVAGEYIDDGEVNVSGVFIGPANAGVTVNGVLASMHDGRFYANNVPVNSGENIIKAVGVTASGVTVEDTVTVNADGSGYYTIEVSPIEGIAPFTAEFAVKSVGTFQIEYTRVNYGDGSKTEGNGSSTPVFNHTYTSPGVYTATFTIVNKHGISREKMTTVVVQDPIQLDQMFNEIWNDMNTALVAGEITQATTYLNRTATEKYVPVFNILLSDMQNIVNSYSPLRRISVGEDLAEYAVIRIQHGEKRLYLINFLQGFDGIWRIDSM